MEAQPAGEWFLCKGLNILWLHFMVYKSVDHEKMWSILFCTITMKISRRIRSKIGAKSRAHVTALTIAVFPPEAMIFVGNFLPIAFLTVYNLTDFALLESVDNFSSFSKFSLRCVACHVILQSNSHRPYFSTNERQLRYNYLFEKSSR